MLHHPSEIPIFVGNLPRGIFIILGRDGDTSANIPVSEEKF